MTKQQYDEMLRAFGAALLARATNPTPERLAFERAFRERYGNDPFSPDPDHPADDEEPPTEQQP